MNAKRQRGGRRHGLTPSGESPQRRYRTSPEAEDDLEALCEAWADENRSRVIRRALRVAREAMAATSRSLCSLWTTRSPCGCGGPTPRRNEMASDPVTPEDGRDVPCGACQAGGVCDDICNCHDPEHDGSADEFDEEDES